MYSQNYSISKDPLSLDGIRGILNRLEDTILFSLIERAQFAHNPRMYERGAFPEINQLGFDGSWLEWILLGVESFHAQARRYTSPDEYPFTPLSSLPSPVIPPLRFPKILYPNNINVNPTILSHYVSAIVPRVTRSATLALAAAAAASGDRDAPLEDDGNYGSAATIDVEVLQAISKRVHYGKFVSESKFTSCPSLFIPHILNPDRAALAALITKPEVERALLERLRKKAATYAQDFDTGQPGREKIDVDGVVELYESFIIPLTKEVEVDYLLHRLDGLSQQEIGVLLRRT